MYMIDEIVVKRDRIHAIAKRHRAERLWGFGSSATATRPLTALVTADKTTRQRNPASE